MPILRFGVFEVDQNPASFESGASGCGCVNSRCDCCLRLSKMPAGLSHASNFAIDYGPMERSSISTARSTRPSASCVACSETLFESALRRDTLEARLSFYRFSREDVSAFCVGPATRGLPF